MTDSDYTTEARALFALFCRYPATDDCVAALAEWLRARDGKDAE